MILYLAYLELILFLVIEVHWVGLVVACLFSTLQLIEGRGYMTSTPTGQQVNYLHSSKAYLISF